MADLEVQLGGLQSLATQHEVAAVELVGGVGRANVGPAHQPSAAAVSAVQAAVDALAGRLAARTSNTGAKLDTVATAFGEQEHSSAALIASSYPVVNR